MEKELREQFLQAMFRLRKAEITMPPGIDLHMGESFVLGHIAAMEEHGHDDVNITDVVQCLHVSKPAISHMLNVLEKKGYITRSINEQDRRRITVSLTDKGRRITRFIKDCMDSSLDEIIERFGRDDILQLITLFNRYHEIAEQVKREMPPVKWEDTQC